MSAAQAAGAHRATAASWDGQRYRNALFVRRVSIRQLAVAAGVSRPHLTRVIHGERPATEHILRTLQEAVGPVGWAYATGQTNELPAQGATDGR